MVDADSVDSAHLCEHLSNYRHIVGVETMIEHRQVGEVEVVC